MFAEVKTSSPERDYGQNSQYVRQCSWPSASAVAADGSPREKLNFHNTPSLFGKIDTVGVQEAAKWAHAYTFFCSCLLSQ